ncbi:TonB-dependent receptor [Methylomonas albis]|uniref:TonB-dependent receptor n=1 Tax=Methylomonas albis TaxID=1854563 RepID=A0ABR9D383_9GAMM|nr:TonB-dependent receptor [Methylomonas albis]MBD9357575.1 TonB-dependent receptor [Methylomonas albis]CAD6880873.1 TonB-dependent receptor [Methylomonas albis]
MKFTFTNSLYAIPVAFMISPAFAAEQTAPDELADVEVIETTPLDGVGKTKDQIPAPVQTATDKDISKTNAINISDFMNRSLGSVYVNDTQGNGFQPDINYRGFTASPLAGTPQGLSVYMDGVRLNQPFGDVMSWDLIPRSAIKSMTMMPGSNPLFGRNTLGGALSLETKDGKSNPGTSVQGLGGSYGRNAYEFEHGGYDKQHGLNWFVTGNYYQDQGWRQQSPSNVRQIFGKAGWEGEKTDLKLTTAYNDNSLIGNGLQTVDGLKQDYTSVYTTPDITENRSLFLNLEGKYQLNSKVLFAGNTYYRNIKTGSLNGDINNDAGTAAYLPLGSTGSTGRNRSYLTSQGYTLLNTAENSSNTAFPYLRCIAQAAATPGGGGDEPSEKCNGIINQSTTQQQNWGTQGQGIISDKLFGMDNQFLFGGAYDQSVIGYNQYSQYGYLNPNGSVTAVSGAAATATNNGLYFNDASDGGSQVDNRVSLSGDTVTWSFFTEDTFSPTKNLHITASGRYNYTSVSNKDSLASQHFLNHELGADNYDSGAAIDPSASLTGKHVFDRFNPAVGLTYNPYEAIGFYAGYNEGTRAPTTIELGCANPNQPCRMPNAMAGDPALKQVITQNWETGFRGLLPGKVNWSLGYFNILNTNDIQFIAAPDTIANGYGYFKNFGKTQRQGIEASLDRKVEDWSIGANYTYLDATYQSTEVLNSQYNLAGSDPGQDGSTITVRPGDHIPLVPKHTFKTYVDYQVTKEWGTNLNIIGFSQSFVRGNENNNQQANGTLPGYVVVNYGVRYTPDMVKGLQVFGQVNNLLDEHYYTAGQFGAAGIANGSYQGNPAGTTFYGPGAPRTWWLGMRYSF